MEISSALLGVLATIGSLIGVKLSTDEDLYSLGGLFYNWVERQKELTWETVSLTFASASTIVNGKVNVDSEFFAWVKDFYNTLFINDATFPTIDYRFGLFVSRSSSWARDYNKGFLIDFKELVVDQTVQISSYISMKVISTTSGTNRDRVAFEVFLKDIRLGGNSLSINNGNGVFSVMTDVTVMPVGVYFVSSLGSAYNSGNIYQYTLDELNIKHNGTVSIPNQGVVDWGGLGDYVGGGETEEETDDVIVGLPVPPNLGDLVGDDVVIDGGVTLPSDEPITFPTIDNPPITITPDNIITDTPIDPPITGGDIPTIPPIILPPVTDPPIIDDGDDGVIDDGENDILSPKNSNVSGGLYYYYIGTDISDSTCDDVIGHATGVVSLSYTPYLRYSDCNITNLPYDKERFNNLINIKDNFRVYRINDVTRPIKKVGGFLIYDDDLKIDIGEGKPYSYRNETKLYQYPYSFAYLHDGINNPLEIKYHYLPYVYNDVYIKQTVSDKCTYSIFVQNYKGDNEGHIESMILTSGNELPCSSSTYAQWFATNRNQLAQNIQNIQNTNAIQNHGNMQQFDIFKDSSNINGMGSLIGAIGSLFSLDFGQSANSVTSLLNLNNTIRSQQAQLNTSIALNKQSEQNAIQSALALNSDMRNSPSSLVSHGSNVFYGLVNNNKKLLLIRMGLNEEDYYRIGTYFTMYGYKQNKIMNINLRSRKYFNYFKIVSPNILAPNVPSNHLEKIKEIFTKGITLWHYNNSPKVLDYFHGDNYEVE